MRLGCCGSMISPAVDPVGIDIVEDLKDFGFDYIELAMSGVAALSDSEFTALAGRLKKVGLPCEACNNFFPPRLRLTGAEARLATAVE